MTTIHAPASPLAEDPATVRARRVWSAGDYDRIASGFREEAETFVALRGIRAGMRVLDAACGSGNVTIPAARRGATVVGLDVAAPLLERAREWARDEGYPVALDEGTVEAMPYPEAHFDVVLSMFGLMFAANPGRVAAELARVTRRGGTVALANWTRDGFVGRMLAAHVAAVPAPAGIPSPLRWADEDALLERFPRADWTLALTPRTLTFRYPYTPAGTAELFRVAYGPTVRTMEALGEDGRAHLAATLRELWEAHAVPGATGTEVRSEYLEVVATRR